MVDDDVQDPARGCRTIAQTADRAGPGRRLSAGLAVLPRPFFYLVTDLGRQGSDHSVGEKGNTENHKGEFEHRNDFGSNAIS